MIKNLTTTLNKVIKCCGKNTKIEIFHKHTGYFVIFAINNSGLSLEVEAKDTQYETLKSGLWFSINKEDIKHITKDTIMGWVSEDKGFPTLYYSDTKEGYYTFNIRGLGERAKLAKDLKNSNMYEGISLKTEHGKSFSGNDYWLCTFTFGGYPNTSHWHEKESPPVEFKIKDKKGLLLKTILTLTDKHPWIYTRVLVKEDIRKNTRIVRIDYIGLSIKYEEVLD